MHAIIAIPPSQSPPAILVLAHKCDLLKTGGVSGTSLEQLGINRVRTVLERELDKRRRSHTGSVAIDELGAEGEDTSELGGLDSIGPPGEAFKFAEWEGGEIEFIGSWVSIEETVELEDEKGRDSVGDGSSRLSTWLQALH
jgi:signal recognition particle receptor subunit beta